MSKKMKSPLLLGNRQLQSFQQKYGSIFCVHFFGVHQARFVTSEFFVLFRDHSCKTIPNEKKLQLTGAAAAAAVAALQ
jgi:hypothetical protein